MIRWRLYWNEEPWGPYRDNMHAAMIVTELLKPHISKGGRAPAFQNYLFRHPEDALDDQRRAAYARFMGNRSKAP